MIFWFQCGNIIVKGNDQGQPLIIKNQETEKQRTTREAMDKIYPKAMLTHTYPNVYLKPIKLTININFHNYIPCLLDSQT